MSLSQNMLFGFPQQYNTQLISESFAPTRRSTISTTKGNFTACSCPNLTNLDKSQNDTFFQQVQKGFQDAADMYRASLEGSHFNRYKTKPAMMMLCYYCGVKTEPEISRQKDFEECYEKSEMDDNPFENKDF